ncbi:MAG: hypothetical protein WAL75_06540 [Terracidiphilus sp.]
MADDTNRTSEKQQSSGDDSHGQFTPAGFNGERQHEFQTKPSDRNQHYGDEDIEKFKKFAIEFWQWLRLQNVGLHKWVTLGVEVLAFGGLVYYACVTERMWKEMQHQTKIQGDTQINSERAWVGLDGPVAIDALQLTPIFGFESHYTVKNFGNGPAFKVMAQGWPWTDPKTFDNLAKTVCEGPIEFNTGTVPIGPGMENPGPFGYMLFPGGTHAENVGSPIDPWTGPPLPDLKHFWFVGCIAYIDQFKAVHWTRFCMEPVYVRQTMTKDIKLQYCSRYNDAGDIPTQQR